MFVGRVCLFLCIVIWIGRRVRMSGMTGCSLASFIGICHVVTQGMTLVGEIADEVVNVEYVDSSGLSIELVRALLAELNSYGRCISGSNESLHF